MVLSMQPRTWSSLLLLFATASAAAPVGTVSLDAHKSIWVLHPKDVGYGARSPMLLALRDVQRDWYKVLGAPPATVVSTEIGAAALPAGFNGTALFFGAAADWAAQLDGEEEHAIVLVQPGVQPGGGGAAAPLLSSLSSTAPSTGPTLIAAVGGSHIRGSVYAAYSVSERLLGVEPLYWWTDTGT